MSSHPEVCAASAAASARRGACQLDFEARQLGADISRQMAADGPIWVRVALIGHSVRVLFYAGRSVSPYTHNLEETRRDQEKCDEYPNVTM